jgi:FMN phosphatase YigB (HAD superfamily)
MTGPTRSRIKLVVTDLDNTVYDWVSFFIPSFRVMLAEVSRISGVQSEALIDSFRRVNQRYGTTEYAFAVEELDVLEPQDRGLSMAQRAAKYRSALNAFAGESRRRLRPYPGVVKTIRTLREHGIPVVAHSDSMILYTGARLRQLGLDTLFSALAAPESHGLPEHASVDDERSGLGESLSPRTDIITLPSGVRKPQRDALLPVLRKFGVDPSETVYVGDSLSRDVLLARRCGVLEVWAEYGQLYDRNMYQDLLRITYWTERDIAEEKRHQQELGLVGPTHTIRAYDELLSVIDSRTSVEATVQK